MMFSSKHFMAFGIIVAAFLTLFTCLHGADEPQKEQATSPLAVKLPTAADTATSFEVVSENTRIALLKPCGRCHQSTLDSYKPGAVAIFDLDAGEQWHSKLNGEQLNGLDRRAKGNSSLSEEERTQIAEFVALKRGSMQ